MLHEGLLAFLVTKRSSSKEVHWVVIAPDQDQVSTIVTIKFEIDGQAFIAEAVVITAAVKVPTITQHFRHPTVTTI